MVKSIDNKFAVFIIIIIVVGLFLHYEMNYNFDLFTVGGKRRPHGRWNHPPHHHYNRYRNVYHPWVHSSVFSHEPTIYEKHNKLKQDYEAIKDHHDGKGDNLHSHQEECPNCTSDDDPNKHTGGKVHPVTVYSV